VRVWHPPSSIGIEPDDVTRYAVVAGVRILNKHAGPLVSRKDVPLEFIGCAIAIRADDVVRRPPLYSDTIRTVGN